MKKLIFNRALFCFVLFCFLTSCQKEENFISHSGDVIESADKQVGISEKENRSLFNTENCNFSVHGVNFFNGVNSQLKNNMLHFSSIEQYYQVLDQLEIQLEAYEDAFVNTYSNEDDESEAEEENLNNIEESIDFNADQPLDDFELENKFYSLRAELSKLEKLWLETSDQVDFDWNNDPENDAPILGLEASLYNPQGEVMICGIIYKRTLRGLYSLNSNSVISSNILEDININGYTPEEIEQKYQSSDYSYEEDEYTNGDDCIGRIDKRVKRYFKDNKYKVKAYHKISGYSGPFHYTFKSITKNYKRKRGKWKSRRIRSYAGFIGKATDHNLCCPYLQDVNSRCTRKKRKRREHTIRISRRETPCSRLSTNKNSLWSTHNQHSWTYNFEVE